MTARPVIAHKFGGTSMADAKRIRAVGVAPVGAEVSINGQPVTLDRKHRFDTWVEPVGSPPVLLFRMRSDGVPEMYLVRTLKRGSEE